MDNNIIWSSHFATQQMQTLSHVSRSFYPLVEKDVHAEIIVEDSGFLLRLHFKDKIELKSSSEHGFFSLSKIFASSNENNSSLPPLTSVV